MHKKERDGIFKDLQRELRERKEIERKTKGRVTMGL